jgi:hypothetical protein
LVNRFWIDILIFIICPAGITGIGFLGENELPDDCYVVARSTSAGHIGLSVVPTDVGGKFLIRTGRVGFCYRHFR